MDLFQEQIDLEQEQIGLGATRYNADSPLPWRTSSSALKEETSRKPGKYLLEESLTPMVQAISEFFESCINGKAGRRHSAYLRLSECDPYALAYMTARSVINAASATASGHSAYIQQVAMQLGKMIDDNQRFTEFATDYKGLYHATQSRVSKATTGRHKLATMRKALSITHIAPSDWTSSEHLRVGEKLIDMYICCCNIAVVGTQGSIRKRKTRKVIALTQATVEWLSEAHEKCSLMAPLRLPMVVKPVDWTNPTNGGYLTPAGRRDFYLVKTQRRNTLDDMFSTDMPDLYKAVNAVQSTPWQINKPVLNVMQALWDEGTGLGGLPQRHENPLPPKSWGEDQEVDPLVLKMWKIKAAEVYEANAKMVGKRIKFAQTLWTADKFAEHEAIYFVHSVDFRGRLYSAVTALSPQGEDSSKGLLRFSEGKALGESGAYWLAVHIANVFGHDKLSLDERAQWTMDNTPMLMDCAFDPLDGTREWLDADKPWCALAGCLEWAGFQVEGENFVSHLPIAQDGSCSGLQHFSALLRDEVGGAAVNLIPQELPADIYTTVAQKVQGWVDASADREALCWKDGMVIRKIVKQPTMTYAYSATQFGMRDQIITALKKLDEEARGEYLSHVDGRTNGTDATYLSVLVMKAIRETVIAAASGMDWLKQAAKVCNENGLPISWTSPIGLPVVQDVREPILTRSKLHFAGQRVDVTLRSDGDKIAKRRQISSIAPNFVHAQDAGHLMLTVNASVDAGLNNFAMIHDSFAVHAADTDQLNLIIRDEFCDMYSVDWLEEFKDGLEAQLPTHLFETLPVLPPKGKLDIEEVMNSDFFFS